MKIVLIGATTPIGLSFLKIAPKRGATVHSIIESHEINSSLINRSKSKLNEYTTLDINNRQKFQEFCFKEWPDVIINCLESLDCEESMADKNTYFPKFLAQLTHHLGIKLIHLSSIAVFNGDSDRAYRATDKPNPFNYYGQTKLMGEKEILRNNNSNPIILRVPQLILGDIEIPYRTFNHKIIAKAQKRIPIQVNKLCNRQPVGSNNIADVLIELTERNNLHGIYHWAGAEVINEYDLAFKVLDRAAISNPKSYLKDVSANEGNLNFLMDLNPLKNKLKTKTLNIDKTFKELNFKEPLELS